MVRKTHPTKNYEKLFKAAAYEPTWARHTVPLQAAEILL
jgi:hypothetical protein